MTSSPAQAEEAREEAAWERLWQGVSGSFSVPVSDWSERKHASFLRNALDGFSGSIAIGVPVQMDTDEAISGAGVRERTGRTATARLTIKYNPISAWFAAGTAYYYTDPNLKADWDPDFSYAFGYDDWRPYTVSLVYANYGGNRFSPNRAAGEQRTDFSEGTITLGWKFPVPKKIARPFLLDRDQEIGCVVGYNASPRYFDLDSGERRSWKQSASLGCKYVITGNFYLNWAAYFYPHAEQQQPWDPDFTYGFGYFDWRPGTFTVQYNNYSGNRFPGRQGGDNTGRFRDGEIMVGWSWSF